MPGRGQGQGRRGGGTAGKHGRGRAGKEERSAPTEPSMQDGDASSRGRSEMSPGHQKKAAGAQSARDFAPGQEGLGGEARIEETGDAASGRTLG